MHLQGFSVFIIANYWYVCLTKERADQRFLPLLRLTLSLQTENRHLRSVLRQVLEKNGYEEGQRSPRKDNLFRTESSDICADTFSWTHSDKCSQIILCNRLFRQENTRLNQITPEKCRFSRLESADYGEPHYVRYDDDEDI